MQTESASSQTNATLTIRLPAKRPLTPFDKHQRNIFQQRMQMFLRSLPASRRAEIAKRPRFRNQPYLRRSDEPADDDLSF